MQCVTLTAKLLPILHKPFCPKRRVVADLAFKHHRSDRGGSSPVRSLVDQPPIPRECAAKIARAVGSDSVQGCTCGIEGDTLVRQCHADRYARPHSSSQRRARSHRPQPLDALPESPDRHVPQAGAHRHALHRMARVCHQCVDAKPNVYTVADDAH